MKKKVLAMFLAAAMVVSMAACGSGDSEANQGNDTQQGDDAQEPAGDDAQEPAGDDAQEPAGDDAQEPAENGGAADVTLDGSWPEETVKIGFVGYDQASGSRRLPIILTISVRTSIWRLCIPRI